MAITIYLPKALEDFWSERWKEVLVVNAVIGQALSFEPEEEFYAGSGPDSAAYSPKMMGVHRPADQREEVDRWLEHLKMKLGNTQYSRQHQLHWPEFHRDWNALMEAIARLKEKGRWPYTISPNRYWMWTFVAHECGVEDVTDRVPHPAH